MTSITESTTTMHFARTPAAARRLCAVIATLATVVVLASVGCTTANYTTPGAAVNLSALADTDIRDAFSIQPASPFPARMAIARLQSSGYHAGYGQTARVGYGHGKYSVITTRDLETEADLLRISQMPGIADIVPIGRILIPKNLESVRDLRVGVANLRADLLLLYTTDTTFVVDGTPLGPLSLITLGFIPNRVAHVTATTSCAVVDVRTGFIYGVTEATAIEEQRHTRWSSRLSIETARRVAERTSLDGMLDNLEPLWGDIVAEHFPERRSPER